MLQLYKEIWKRRELVKCMAAGQEKAALFKTALGRVWLLLVPAMQICVYYMLIAVIFRSGRDPGAGFLAICLGVLHYLLLGNATSQCQPAIHGNSSLLLQVRLEPLLLVWVGFLRALRQWAAGLAVFFFLYILMGPAPTLNLIAYPAIVLMWAVFCWSVGLWVAQAAVFVRDIEKIVPIILQLLMYTAPVLYPAKFYPAGWISLAIALNPVAAAFALFRWSLLGEPCAVGLCAVSLVVWTAGSVIFSHWFYQAISKGFTKVI